MDTSRKSYVEEKRRGERKAEGDMYRSIADRGVFWKGFFEQLGRISGASRLQVGEARGEEAGGRLREGFDELAGGLGMDVQAELPEVVVEGRDRLDAQIVDDDFAGAVREAPGDGGTLLEESPGTGPGAGAG
ncbi:MAG: hypothetical protein ACOX1P_31965 [Thermoguttaceae bacterium]